ncbi:YopX family protein, partial [Listeria farberi]
MRVIEFRAWDKEVKEMDYNPSVIEIWQNKPINEQFRLESEEKLVWMQYTGLKDKNGKKIFEGDIVDISVYDRLDWSSIKGKVVFLNGAWLVEDVGHFAIT